MCVCVVVVAVVCVCVCGGGVCVVCGVWCVVVVVVCGVVCVCVCGGGGGGVCVWCVCVYVVVGGVCVCVCIFSVSPSIYPLKSMSLFRRLFFCVCGFSLPLHLSLFLLLLSLFPRWYEADAEIEVPLQG